MANTSARLNDFFMIEDQRYLLQYLVSRHFGLRRFVNSTPACGTLSNDWTAENKWKSIYPGWLLVRLWQCRFSPQIEGVMKACLSTLLLLLAVGKVRAEIVYPSTTPTERLLNKVVAVHQYLNTLNPSSTADEKITQLDYSGVREQLTELQNLIRVYQDMKCCKTLKPFYEEAKKFEDLISHVRDYKYFYQDAGDEVAKQKYKKILDHEVGLYSDFLQNSSWFKVENQSFLKKLESALKDLALPNEADERNAALTVLAHRLEQIHKKTFDLTKVELGVHEFKRDVRRFSYLRRGYQDLVTTDYKTCPASLEEIKEQEVIQYACAVSSCLTSKLDAAASQLDSIKMQGLQYELRGETAPKDVTDQAQAIHDDIKGSRVLLMIAEQLKQCKTKSAAASKDHL